MRRRVSSEEVARLAGVSRSTVSRVFTPGTYVSSDARERVLRAADAIGYSPNAIARGLTMQRTKLIGVIVGQLENPFYAQILQTLAETLQEHGLASLVLVASPTEMDTLIPSVLGYQVDGVIITEATLSSRMASRCQSAGIPVVLVNRYVDSDVIASVVGDNVNGAAQVARHLVELGRKRIAYMAGLPEASSSRDREQGFRTELSEHGIKLHARVVGHYTLEGGVEAARQLLGSDAPPDAVFCANDVMAMATIDVARSEFGLSIPRDLAVAGYDNSPFARLPSYQLTSVDQDTKAMAELAVSVVTQQADENSPRPQVIRVPARLVTRGSA